MVHKKTFGSKIMTRLIILFYSVFLASCASSSSNNIQSQILSKSDRLRIELKIKNGVVEDGKPFHLLQSGRYGVFADFGIETVDGEIKYVGVGEDLFGLLEVKDADEKVVQVVNLNRNRTGHTKGSRGTYRTDVVVLRKFISRRELYISVKEMNIPNECQRFKCIIELRFQKFRWIT